MRGWQDEIWVQEEFLLSVLQVGLTVSANLWDENWKKR